MKIGIVSLGLIGGSILKALSCGDFELYAVTRNDKAIESAKKYTENVSSDINILKSCEVVFVASPIDKTVEMLEKLENIVNRECIVLDCASVKESIMKKNYSYKFIGSHPMAGTEFNGFDASFKELFNGAKWVLTPPEKIKQEDLNIAERIIKFMGAEVIITDAKSHDEAVAMISHMPLLVSQALFLSAKDNNLALKLASSGFRDMTRLSMSNSEMAIDMLNNNEKNIDKALEKLYISINFLKKAKDFQKLSDIKNTRSKMYSCEGKNILQ